MVSAGVMLAIRSVGIKVVSAKKCSSKEVLVKRSVDQKAYWFLAVMKPQISLHM